MSEIKRVINIDFDKLTEEQKSYAKFTGTTSNGYSVYCAGDTPPKMPLQGSVIKVTSTNNIPASVGSETVRRNTSSENIPASLGSETVRRGVLSKSTTSSAVPTKVKKVVRFNLPSDTTGGYKKKRKTRRKRKRKMRKTKKRS